MSRPPKMCDPDGRGWLTKDPSSSRSSRIRREMLLPSVSGSELDHPDRLAVSFTDEKCTEGMGLLTSTSTPLYGSP